MERMRWKAFFFLRNDDLDSDDSESKETFGLRTRKCLPRVNELEAFEDDLLKMIENIDFRRTSSDLQRRLDKDIQKMKNSKDVIVPADKTRNLYAVPKKKYNKFLRENITKSYKPAPDETYQEINDEARDIAASLEMSERMNCMAKKEAFITLKDHKVNFANALPCRLINPVKPEMGKISKATLDRIILAVQQQLPLNMWKSTGAVSDWFTRIERKQECTFICFDIVEFYPLITKDLLDRALDFASGFTLISQKDKDIIFNSRKSMLFGQGREWIKKGTGLFDVTMGCYDGAEVCELVGMFALSRLAKGVPAADSIGLYRDDGLGVLRNSPGSKADRIRKDIIKVFADLGLRITIQTNLKVADFLDYHWTCQPKAFTRFASPTTNRCTSITSRTTRRISSGIFQPRSAAVWLIFPAIRMSLQMPSHCITRHFERVDLARKRNILNAGRSKAERTGEHTHERLFGLTHHSARTLQRTSAEDFVPLCLNTSRRLPSWTRSSTPTRWRLVIVACQIWLLSSDSTTAL